MTSAAQLTHCKPLSLVWKTVPLCSPVSFPSFIRLRPQCPDCKEHLSCSSRRHASRGVGQHHFPQPYTPPYSTGGPAKDFPSRLCTCFIVLSLNIWCRWLCVLQFGCITPVKSWCVGWILWFYYPLSFWMVMGWVYEWCKWTWSTMDNPYCPEGARAEAGASSTFLRYGEPRKHSCTMRTGGQMWELRTQLRLFLLRQRMVVAEGKQWLSDDGPTVNRKTGREVCLFHAYSEPQVSWWKDTHNPSFHPLKILQIFGAPWSKGVT